MDTLAFQMDDITSFGFLPALFAGFRDNFCPGGMLSLFLFGLFLIAMSRYPKYSVLGAYFTAGAGAMHFFLSFGYADRFMNSPVSDTVFDVAYFVLVLCFLLAGVALARDWLMIRLHKDQARLMVRSLVMSFTAFMGPKGKVRWTMQILILLASLGLGAAAAFLRSAWPPDAYTALVTYQMRIGPKIQEVLALSLIYILGFIFVYFVLWIAACLLRRYTGWGRFLRHFFTTIRAAGAAVCLGFGLAFLAYYRS